MDHRTGNGWVAGETLRSTDCGVAIPNHALAAVRSYYHKILPFYEEEEEQRDDLDFWRGLVVSLKPDNVLELGAGSGRITAALRNLAPVVALDLSLEMLQRASRRLSESSGDIFPVFLINADMRRFALRRRFDLVIAANDPFSHLTQRRERQLAIRAIARHLAPGGTLVIEGLYRPERKAVESPERFMNGVSVKESWTPLGRDNRWRARYLYRRGTEQVDAEFVARSWDLEERHTLFACCGLEVKEVWGSFDRCAFTPYADRMILVIERTGSRA